MTWRLLMKLHTHHEVGGSLGFSPTWASEWDFLKIKAKGWWCSSMGKSGLKKKKTKLPGRCNLFEHGTLFLPSVTFLRYVLRYLWLEWCRASHQNNGRTAGTHCWVLSACACVVLCSTSGHACCYPGCKEEFSGRLRYPPLLSGWRQCSVTGRWFSPHWWVGAPHALGFILYRFRPSHYCPFWGPNAFTLLPPQDRNPTKHRHTAQGWTHKSANKNCKSPALSHRLS